MKFIHVALRRAAIGWLVLGAGWVQAQNVGPAVCGSLDNHYGPFDYRVERGEKLTVVERFHFTPDVESLRGGASSSKIGGDLSYTLRAFPNHHRALHTLARLAVKEKTATPRGSRYTVDCWFERAMRFRHDDGTVRMIYGIYLFQTNKKADALKMLESAEELGESSANFHYNMGLLYADFERYDDARRHAHRAYALGFSLPGLRNRLQRAGQWREPEPVPAPQAPVEAPPASQ